MANTLSCPEAEIALTSRRLPTAFWNCELASRYLNVGQVIPCPDQGLEVHEREAKLCKTLYVLSLRGHKPTPTCPSPRMSPQR